MAEEWEDFIDGMDESEAFDGRVFVPLAGEWRVDGSAYVTRILEKRDWVTALQRSQWQRLFGRPPSYSEDNLQGFMRCPVGFALVQYVIFLVHKLRSELPEDAAKINLESMLFAFVSILDSNFDHLESSNWNVSSFDLAVNLNLEDPNFYPRYSDYIDTLHFKLHLPSWRDDWPEYRKYQGFEPSEPLPVALVGEHGPSNLENLAAAQAALNVHLEAQHFFTYMWQLKDLSHSKSVRITWDAFWGEPLTESAGRDKTSGPSWTIDEAVYSLRSFARRDLFLRQVLREGLVICSEPLWLCVLLHAATQSRRQVTRASAAGRVMCFLVDFDQVFGIQEVEQLWALIPNFASSLITATSRITAEMIHWQTALRVAYVPCVSLHVTARHEPQLARPELLFFRSSLPAASPFLTVLRLLEAESKEDTWPIVAMTKPLSFEEIASFRAVALLPHIPNALRLSDLYAMHLPIFIPDEPLIQKFLWPDDPLPLLSKARMSHAKSRNEEENEKYEENEENTQNDEYYEEYFEFSPLDFQAAGRRFYRFRAHRHYWLQYTEWWLRPHLQRFSAKLRG